MQNDYERLIRPIERQMMRSVWRITQNADDAEDAFQEATIQIWKSRQRVNQHANPQALILRICTQAACDIVRKKLRLHHREHSLETSVIGTTDADVDAQILMIERQDDVKTAIARLSEQQAIAVTMRYLLDCPFDEVAQGLECSEATARVHVSRGLAQLRHLLVRWNPTPKQESQS